MITVSIIIVNYKVKEFIIPCIESIYENQPKNYLFEIIIVDNNSRDGSIEIINKKFPYVITIENKKNVGFSPAVNQGAKKAKGKFLFLLNPDTLLIEDSLSKLISFAKKQNNLGVIGPCLVNKSGEIQQSFWRKPTLFNTILSLYHLDHLNNKKNYNQENKKESYQLTQYQEELYLFHQKFFNY